jgi:hypothetical protein
MDLLSISLLGGGLVLIWAAVKNKSPLDVIKLLTSGKNPEDAATVTEPFSGGTIPEAPSGPPSGLQRSGKAISGSGGSDPPMVI